MKIGSTLIIGAGGIGSHLAEPLARLLTHHDNGPSTPDSFMKIVDGDIYERKNLERQMFDAQYVDQPKAEILADRVSGIGGEECEYEHGYVSSSEDAGSLMMRQYAGMAEDEALLVCLCVDNDATRRLFYDAMALLPMDHPIIVMLDCGNDLETSTVVTSIWHQRKSKLANPVDVYANLKTPGDRVPGGGCQDMAPSTPQLMVANMAAAFSAMLTVQALLDGAGWTDVVMTNIRKFSVGVAGGEYGF